MQKGLSKEEALEVELKAIIEYRLQFYAECENKIKALYEADMDRLEKSLEQSKARIRELTEQGVKTKADINHQLTEVSHLETRLSTLEQEKEQALKDEAAAKRQIQTLDGKVKQSQKEAKENVSELKRLRHLEPEKLKAKLHEANSELKANKKQLAEASRLARSRKNEIDQLTRQLKEAEAKIKEAEEEQVEEEVS
ncbi:hypothetical protein M3P05_04435 [Sansalvadorimonas sp. 2012CJ34-2]|uniref:Myosin heavy chain n=1 Tax=Parendozoicomonas callyspongiae TaxID=2942213 RepID=A0ABT0PD93_9GAMM|nr:hypothetical protein [Sansalvadorimonas sp. 2012CJ34-2]MCL6269191.1 hypothetical protein [Sansalvadorimonas sp. 2012CJ34-2]